MMTLIMTTGVQEFARKASSTRSYLSMLHAMRARKHQSRLDPQPTVRLAASFGATECHSPRLHELGVARQACELSSEL
jgi:hypothetical protein